MKLKHPTPPRPKNVQRMVVKKQLPKTLQEAARDNGGQLTPEIIEEVSENYKFSRFMIDTLAGALWQWMDNIDQGLLPKDSKFCFGQLKNACSHFVNKTKLKNEETEEVFYETADEFLAIMKLMMNLRDSKSKHNLLGFCTQLCSGDINELKDLYIKLGVFISQQSVASATRLKAA